MSNNNITNSGGNTSNPTDMTLNNSKSQDGDEDSVVFDELAFLCSGQFKMGWFGFV